MFMYVCVCVCVHMKGALGSQRQQIPPGARVTDCCELPNLCAGN